MQHPIHDHTNLLGFHAVVDGPEGMSFVSSRPAIFIPQPAGSPAGGTGHSHNPARCGSDLSHSLHESADR